MSADARARLALRLAADYASGGHRKWFTGDLNDAANIVAEAVAADLDAIAHAALAGTTLAAIMAIAGGTRGIGTPDADRIPLGAFLGSAAFGDLDILTTLNIVQHDAAYQMLPQDRAALLFTTTGTNTWTLPLSSDVPAGWWVRYKNRSGNNLTLARTGSDTIDGAASNLTVTTGTSGIIGRQGVTANWEHG